MNEHYSLMKKSGKVEEDFDGDELCYLVDIINEDLARGRPGSEGAIINIRDKIKRVFTS